MIEIIFTHMESINYKTSNSQREQIKYKSLNSSWPSFLLIGMHQSYHWIVYVCVCVGSLSKDRSLAYKLLFLFVVWTREFLLMRWFPVAFLMFDHVCGCVVISIGWAILTDNWPYNYMPPLWEWYVYPCYVISLPRSSCIVNRDIMFPS